MLSHIIDQKCNRKGS